MEIRLDPHTLERAQERGASETEIRETLMNGSVLGASRDRLAKAMVFPYNQHRLGKYYAEKRVQVIYVLERDVMVTVTVYVFYGKWDK
ncbi:MAG: DUF4258 domain-containing protein [Anaerolineae bacterium]|nr:DUF4258 domain-containing protein [Anaerolineae bacterium]